MTTTNNDKTRKSIKINIPTCITSDMTVYYYEVRVQEGRRYVVLAYNIFTQQFVFFSIYGYTKMLR